MVTCIKCGKEYDPAYDFCEDTEKLEAIMYYAGDKLEGMCSECTDTLSDIISEEVNKFFTN